MTTKHPEALEVRIDIGALIVRDGTGGLKPLTDRDRREIATTARRLLSTEQHPEAVFTATRFELSVVRTGSSRGTCPCRG